MVIFNALKEFNISERNIFLNFICRQDVQAGGNAGNIRHKLILHCILQSPFCICQCFITLRDSIVGYVSF